MTEEPHLVWPAGGQLYAAPVGRRGLSLDPEGDLEFPLVLDGKLVEGIEDEPRRGAVVHIDGRCPHPLLQVVHGQRDVLGVALQTTQHSDFVSHHIHEGEAGERSEH